MSAKKLEWQWHPPTPKSHFLFCFIIMISLIKTKNVFDFFLNVKEIAEILTILIFCVLYDILI